MEYRPSDSEYECLYTGPALSSDEAGEVQLVADLIAKGVAGIAISPSNAPAMAAMLKEKNSVKMPVMTIDADLAGCRPRLRKTYLGTKNYDMGVKMAQHLMKLNAEGRHRLPAARQRRGEQHQRARRGLPRHDRRQGEDREADRPGRLDRDRRLPALHQ